MSVADELAGSIPLVSEDPQVQRRYEELRRGGQSHNFAEMLATRSFPGFVTDDDFNRGKNNGRQFERTPWLGDQYKSVADRAGVSTTGKWYCSGLAAYPGDPRAWVSGRSDVLSIARERNLNVEGLVNHKAHETEPAELKRDYIAPDILQREADKFIDLGMKPSEAIAAAWDLRTGRNDPHPLLVEDNVPHPEEIIAQDGE
jgi:hypothetical protein